MELIAFYTNFELPEAPAKDYDRQPATLPQGRKAVMELIERLYLKRLKLKEMRNELRQERGVVSQTFAELATLLRIAWTKGVPPERSDFEELYEKSIKTRDELGELEYQYDEAEAEYDALEAELEELEASLPEQEEDHTINEDRNELSMEHRVEEPTSPSQPDANTENIPRDNTTLMEYQSRVGDGNILREQMQDILEEYHKRVKTLNARKLAIASDDLQGYEEGMVKELEAELSARRSALEAIKIDVKRLADEAVISGFDVDLPYWATSDTSTVQPDNVVPTQDERFSDPAPKQNEDDMDQSTTSTSSYARIELVDEQVYEGGTIHDLTAEFPAVRPALEATEIDVKRLPDEPVIAGYEVDLPNGATSDAPIMQPGKVAPTQDALISDTTPKQGGQTAPQFNTSTHSGEARIDIDIWILEQLMESQIERAQFRAILEAKLGGHVDKDTWDRSLLELWEITIGVYDVNDVEQRAGPFGNLETEEPSLTPGKKAAGSTASEAWDSLVKPIAERAVYDFDRKFPFSGSLEKKASRFVWLILISGTIPREMTRFTTLMYYRSHPYKPRELELDMISVYAHSSC